MSYKLIIQPSALKGMKKLPQKARRQLDELIGALADNPRPRGCQKLTDREGYRVRNGNYRIIYDVDDARKLVWIMVAKDRKDIYRRR